VRMGDSVSGDSFIRLRYPRDVIYAIRAAAILTVRPCSVESVDLSKLATFEIRARIGPL